MSSELPFPSIRQVPANDGLGFCLTCNSTGAAALIDVVTELMHGLDFRAQSGLVQILTPQYKGKKGDGDSPWRAPVFWLGLAVTDIENLKKAVNPVSVVLSKEAAAPTAILKWDKLSALFNDPELQGVLDVVKPYLPALARASTEVYEGFIKHLGDKNWTSIDQLMYERMTLEERRELEKEVVAGVRDAAQAQFDRKELTKEILTKIAIRLLTGLL